MSPSPAQIKLVCPTCGATWVTGMTRCYLCGHEYVPENHPIARAESVVEPPQRSFSLATLMLAVTLLSVCLAAGHYSIGLGCLAASVILPTWVVYKRRIRKRHSLDLSIAWSDCAVELLIAAAWVVLVVSIVFAFCSPIFWQLHMFN